MDERELDGLRSRVCALRRDAWAMVEDDELYDPEGALPMAERAAAALRTMERALVALTAQPEPRGDGPAARWLRWERAETSYHVADLIERWSPDVPDRDERALAAASAAYAVFCGRDLRASFHALRLMSLAAPRLGRTDEAVGWVLEFRRSIPDDLAPAWFVPACDRLLRGLWDDHLVDGPVRSPVGDRRSRPGARP